MKNGIMSMEAMPEDAHERALMAQVQQNESDASALTGIAKNTEFLQLQESDQDTESLRADISADVEESVSMEAMADELDRAMAQEQLSISGVLFANLAIESLSSRTSGQKALPSLSMETYKKDPQKAIQAAMEDIKERASELWEGVKIKMASLADSLGAKLRAFQSNIARLEKRAVQVQIQLNVVKEKLGKDAKPRVPILKPQDWFIDLCYHGKPPPPALRGVGKQVEGLLNETGRVVSGAVRNYSEWMKRNHAAALGDVDVFKSLKFRAGDFLVLHSKQFDENRKLGLNKPAPGNSFYRSDELPGGMALFTQVCKQDENGAASIQAVSRIEYQIREYDPTSYSRIKLAILAVIGVPVAAYLSFMGAAFVAANTGAAFAAGMSSGAKGALIFSGTAFKEGSGLVDDIKGAIDKAKDFVKDKDSNGDAYGSSLKLDKDMVFETLSPSEAQGVLSDLAAGVKAMRTWENLVFKEMWADEAFSDLMDKTILNKEKRDEANRVSVRLLKNLCFAILNLQTSLSTGIITYALRTYNAMLNYVQKSIYQYR